MCAAPRNRRPKVSHEVIAKRLNLSRSTVTRILNSDPTYRASEETRNKVLSLAQQLGYNFRNLRRIHRRRDERRSVSIEARLRLVQEDGQVFDEGLGTMTNISLVGALLRNLRFPKQSLPLVPVTVHVGVMEGPLARLSLSGPIARCAYEEEAEIAVSFAQLEAPVLGQLKEALRRLPLRPPSFENQQGQK